jgi:hypothetical protein
MKTDPSVSAPAITPLDTAVIAATMVFPVSVTLLVMNLLLL